MTEHKYSPNGDIHDNKRLKELQSLSLDRKIMITQSKIIEWYNHFNGNVYISFSGGKDSTVLLDITRKIFPDIPAVFSNTGLEYPEVRKFANSFENVDVVYPQMLFFDVIKTYGYPIISKEVSEAIYYARRIANIGGGEKVHSNGWNFLENDRKEAERTIGTPFRHKEQ